MTAPETAMPDKPARHAAAPSIATLAMLQHVSSFWTCRAICVAAELGLADLVAEGPRTVADLARATGAHEPSLRRLLRALAGASVFAERADGSFEQTPLSETLRSGTPGSLRSYVLTELGGERYAAWGELLHSVRTGEPAFDHVHGTSFFDYFAAHPGRAQVFNDAMVTLSDAVHEEVISAADFSRFRTAVDVGGGHGGFLFHLLRTQPEMQGILFDRPDVIAGARAAVASTGLGGRCRFEAGDFFESVPAGADLYLLKLVVHDWDDADAARVLRACRAAMRPESRLMLVEAVVPPGNAAHPAKLLDLSMLAVTGGRERTADEYRSLLDSAGLKLTGVTPTLSPMSVIEAVRA